MTDDYWTTLAMKQSGGSFVQALAEAYKAGDTSNREKIRATWPEYWARYTARGEALRLADEAQLTF